MKNQTFFAALATLALTVTASAQTIVYSQDFNSATTTNPNDLNLYRNSAVNAPSVFAVDTTNDWLDLATNDASSANQATAVVGALPQTYTLGVGDYIQLSLDVKVTSVPGGTAEFRLGLYDTPAALTADLNGDYRGTGYAIWGRTGTGASRFWSYNGGGTSVIFNNTTSTTGTTNDIITPAFSGITTTFVNYSLKVTNVDGTVARLELTENDGTAATRTLLSSAANWNVATPGYFSFDTLMLGTAANADLQYQIDNISVSTTVPEPTTGAMIMAGAISMVLLRRRRQSV